MDRDTVIRLAREAATEDGSVKRSDGKNVVIYAAKTNRFLERFAALVEEHLKAEGYRHCAKGQRTTQWCGMLEQAVRIEREECAKVCDLVAREIDDTNGTATYCAAAIRSRT